MGEQLHWSFNNQHILLPSLTLDSFGNYLIASTIVIAICLSERLFSFILDKSWVPRALRHMRLYTALWNTGLYSFTTILRLCYMLVAMSAHLGLICTIVITLSIAQFFIELRKQPRSPLSLPRHKDDREHHSHHSVLEPLLDHDAGRQYPLKTVQTRPRSKSKPDAIFIHPTESNIARADAVALELGLAGDTELVQGHSYMKEEPAWEIGKGKDLAREMLLGAMKKSSPPVTHKPFLINDDSDSD